MSYRIEAGPADIRVSDYIDATDGIFAGIRKLLPDTIFFYEGQEGRHKKGSRNTACRAMEGAADC